MTNKFTIVKKGYDPREVDAHIEKLDSELNGFRSKESAISKSLVNAEVAASDIVAKANSNAEKMLNDTQEEINNELDTIEKMIVSEKKALEDFCTEYDTIVKNYFTGNAVDITAPLREKIELLDTIIKEARMGKMDHSQDGQEEDGCEGADSGQETVSP